ncbi:MAG: M23 family metallopeptidase [Bacteroidia bacterium]|nr:M23 family metallopeptidase [Bacteroidia bacterium]
MPRSKYKFNPESLSFDKVRLGIRDILLRFLAYFTGSVLIAFVYWVIFAAFFDSPKEKALEREIQQLQIQYDLINREMANVEKVLEDLQKTDDNLYRTIFEAEPLPGTLRDGGVGGVNRYTNLEGYSNSDLVIETTSRLDKIRKRVYMHAGTDVFSTGDGVVTDVQSSQRGLGKHIIIDHGFGYSSVYAHLSNFNVRRGQKVHRGDVIGYVGNTGTSVANHLHYEIKLNGRNVDPVNYYFEDLSPAEYERMIEIASKTGQSFD